MMNCIKAEQVEHSNAILSSFVCLLFVCVRVCARMHICECFMCYM